MKPMLTGIVAAMALAVASGCGPSEAPPPPPPPSRVFTALPADTLWVRGSLEDPLLELPFALAADREQVYFADLAGRRVVALSAVDGTTVWATGGRGAGPEEFERPSALTLLPGSRLAVSDPRNSRIALMTRDGMIQSTFRVEDPEINGLCGLADGTLVSVAASTGPPVVRYGPAGEELERADLPWPELVGVSMLARQTVVAPLADGRRCMIALSLGKGFAVFGEHGFEPVRSYVEDVASPQVEVRSRGNARTRVQHSSVAGATIATRTVTAGPDALYVVFEGGTEDRGRILDVYAPDGSYRHSHRLDRPAASVTFADGVLYVLSHVDAVPTLTALRLREGP